jgi:hypothetical protein
MTLINKMSVAKQGHTDLSEIKGIIKEILNANKLVS